MSEAAGACTLWLKERAAAAAAAQGLPMAGMLEFRLRDATPFTASGEVGCREFI